jgi:hypothetical protein
MGPLTIIVLVVAIAVGIVASYFAIEHVWESTFKAEVHFSHREGRESDPSRTFTFTPGTLANARVRVTRRPPPKRALLEALLVVVVIFLLTVGVLWALTRISGPQEAQVSATIHKLGGTIWITAAGLVGCFVVIAAVGFVAVYYLSRR